MGGKTTDVGNPSDYQFLDPTGQFMEALNRFGAQSADPNAYMNQFMGQSPGLANMAQGATEPLGMSLSQIAGNNARLGGEQALAALGGRNTGAGQAAFGRTYGDEFAKAAAQTQAAQLGLTGQLWNQAMGQNANLQSGAQQLYGNLAGQTGMVYQPSYQYQPSIWERMLNPLQKFGEIYLNNVTGGGYNTVKQGSGD